MRWGVDRIKLKYDYMGRRVETRYETNVGFEYDPYGRIIRMDGATDKIPFRYQSKWDMDYGTEATTQFSWGLVDYGLRFYQPKHGRFINRDPIGEAGGLNLYEAFGGDPLNRWDLLGLKQSKVFDDDNKSDGDAPFSDKVNDLPAFEVRGDPEDGHDSLTVDFFGGHGIPGPTFAHRMGFQPRAREAGSITFNDKLRISYQEHEGNVFITDVEIEEEHVNGNHDRIITFRGVISYNMGGLLLSHGRFTGVVVADTDPSQAYRVRGHLNGIGFQVGWMSGQVPVIFSASSAEALINKSLGGFLEFNASFGFGPANAVTADLLFGAFSDGSGSSNFTGDASGSIFQVHSQMSVFNLVEQPKFRLGVNFGFSGITITETEVIPPAGGE